MDETENSRLAHWAAVKESEWAYGQSLGRRQEFQIMHYCF